MGCELAADAAFYDCFGVAAFIFIIILSVFQLRTKKRLPKLVYWLLLAVGVIGFIIDACMVYFNFLR